MKSTSPASTLFLEEFRDLLCEIDSSVLDLNRTSTDPDLLNRLFRALHTLKGSCTMFGLHIAMSILHELESIWDEVRSGKLAHTQDLLDLTLRIKDALEPVCTSGMDIELDNELKNKLVSLRERSLVNAEAAEAMPKKPDKAMQSSKTSTYEVVLSSSESEIFQKIDIVSILEELNTLGQANIFLDFGRVTPLEQLHVADCHLDFHIKLTTNLGLNAIKDVFIFWPNQNDVRVTELGEVLETPDNPRVQISQSEPLETSTLEDTTQPLSDPKIMAERPLAVDNKAKLKEPVQSLRVEASKLDKLVNLVGELVIAQARLSRLISSAHDTRLAGISEDIERLVANLRDSTLSIRMLPIGTTFNRFRRLVRDLALELGKNIDLVTDGGEAELDKTVIEQLVDPLVHLMRNSIDHGIESPEGRLAAGKPKRGMIRLSAKQAGGLVMIQISDDGKGLDKERIRAKAMEVGLISPQANLPDGEIYKLIFAPGFSTAEKVTNVSGRGVGMDVVKRSIDGLRGKLDIDSTPGRGTMITITLPLTMAIIDGLQVRVNQELYIIPLAMVEECVEFIREGSRESRKRSTTVRGLNVPYVRLREAFALAGESPSLEQLVVIRHGMGRAGIVVDEVLGLQQTVIKGLGKLIGRVEGIAGATINVDGSMALILDAEGLVNGVQRQWEQTWA